MKLFLMIFGLGSLLAIPTPSGATVPDGSNALIFPKRVVFAGRARSAEVTLVNRGRRPLTYRVELVERRMTATGALVQLDSPTQGERSARSLLRYAPRQVVVPPESSQKVRLLLRKPADLAAGEYRSHLLCRALPSPDSGLDLESLGEEKSMAVQLATLPAVSIPVIVRHGDLKASVQLSNVTLGTGPTPELSFRLAREGPASVYGDLIAQWIPSGAGSETVVAQMKGVGVYATLPAVHLRLPLRPPTGTRFSHGRLRLSFRSRPEDDGGGSQITAYAELELPSDTR